MGKCDYVTDKHFKWGSVQECNCLLAVYSPDASWHPAVLSCCVKDWMTDHTYVPCAGSELSVISIMNACTARNSLCLELKRTKCLFQLYC